MLPSNQPRSCFTIWLSEGDRRAHSAAIAGAATVPPPPTDDTGTAAGGGDAGQVSDAVWQFLMQPAVRQHVCKLAYAGVIRGAVGNPGGRGLLQAALRDCRLG